MLLISPSVPLIFNMFVFSATNKELSLRNHVNEVAKKPLQAQGISLRGASP